MRPRHALGPGFGQSWKLPAESGRPSAARQGPIASKLTGPWCMLRGIPDPAAISPNMCWGGQPIRGTSDDHRALRPASTNPIHGGGSRRDPAGQEELAGTPGRCPEDPVHHARPELQVHTGSLGRHRQDARRVACLARRPRQPAPRAETQSHEQPPQDRRPFGPGRAAARAGQLDQANRVPVGIRETRWRTRKNGETCGAHVGAGQTGMLESKPGFQTRKAAENYARDQEAAIRGGTYIDPRAGRITLTEWVNQWYPALDLEPTTLSNYRYQIEIHILPAFGHRALASITAEEVSAWEMQIAASGYSRRTARDARSTLTTVLGDAIPRYIQLNPAQRRRGKGRKGQRRIQRIERSGKAWPTPLQALLIAERCAALSGHDTDFVMVIAVAYTGARWSEIVGLTPECVRGDTVNIDWKLYELNGRFYRGRPKDGSIRPADLPPFLAQLFSAHLRASAVALRCTCRNSEEPWCPGAEYVFLGPGGGHFRRSNYSERFFRPAADGWYLPRQGESQRAAVPVLVTEPDLFPGRPVPPWPAAKPGETFAPPDGPRTGPTSQRPAYGSMSFLWPSMATADERSAHHACRARGRPLCRFWSAARGGQRRSLLGAGASRRDAARPSARPPGLDG